MFSLTNILSANATDLESVDALIKKYKVTAERPKSCPLESKKFADLLAKTETIKSIFKSNCLKNDDGKVTDVLNSVNSVQDELKKKGLIDNTASLGSILGTTEDSTNATATTTTAASSVKMSTLFSNITTVLKKGQCNLEDGRVFEIIADVINDATQLGMLSGQPIGLMVAGGGFVVSSALRLIDMIFHQKFDFDKNQSRQTFIKLNCSFYDIRKDMEGQGALDIETEYNRKDFKEVKSLIEKLTAAQKGIDQETTDQKKVLDSLDQKSLKDLVGDVSIFKKNLLRIKAYLVSGITDSADLPVDTQKFLTIAKIAQDYDILVSQIKSYKELKISAMPMLDDLFLMELKKFDQTDPLFVSQMMNLNSKDFNEIYKAKILFHVSRVLSDIAVKEEMASTQNIEVKKIAVLELQKRKDLFATKMSELKKLEERLGRIVNPKEFSASDDGSDNMISLMENYKMIAGQIYGEWGEKFLSYTTEKSFDETIAFKKKLKHYTEKYDEVDEDEKDKHPLKLPSPYKCQDIQRMKASFKYADSLVQAGYDFIITNKDLFHTDAVSYYGNSLDEEETMGLNATKKIQRHYKSTILAIKKLKFEKIDQDDKERYLKRSFWGHSYLGRSMLDVSDLRVLARNMQRRFDKLNCAKILVDDLN
jgi:hypothetical protein